MQMTSNLPFKLSRSTSQMDIIKKLVGRYHQMEMDSGLVKHSTLKSCTLQSTQAFSFLWVAYRCQLPLLIDKTSFPFACVKTDEC